MKGPIAAFFCAVTSLLVSGQTRNANWVYSSDMWLKFADGTLSWHSPSYHPSLRSACISDVFGNYLLLADDRGIHTPLFDLMPGGDSLTLSWTQAATNYLILPKPGAGQHYIVLRVEADGERRAGWVEVDMEANSGSGAVIGTTTWYAYNVTAKLAASLNSAGDGYWIVHHEDGSDVFMAYALTSSGMDPAPVISHAGNAFTPTNYPTTQTDYCGPMNFSVAGDKVALARMAGTAPDTSQVALFHFDADAGTLAEWCTLNYSLWRWNGVAEYVFLEGQTTGGLDFDASGEHLYAVAWDTVAPDMGNLYAQFTVAAYLDQPTIQHSGSLVYANGNGIDGMANDPAGSQLQLAPNGRLYGRQVSTDPNEFYPLILGLYDLPIAEIPLGPPMPQAELFQVSTATHSDGFPSMCKRYHDNAPEWLGFTANEMIESEVHLRPCPMWDEAALFLPRNEKADAVEWYTNLGVKVLDGSIQRNGPSLVIERKGLPSGVYFLRVLDKGRLVGQTKVICR